MDIKVICCDSEMTLNQYDPDQDQVFVGFDCDKCGASLYGTFKKGENSEEE